MQMRDSKKQGPTGHFCSHIQVHLRANHMCADSSGQVDPVSVQGEESISKCALHGSDVY